MKNAKTEEDKARMKDRWLQIDAEQNEEWLRKQGTGTYIDLSTIKKGDLPGQVILEKHNGYKEMLNKAALDKSKEIAAEGIASWSAANWMESEYPYLTRKEAEAIGKNFVKKASPFVSPYNAFRADAYDTLPITFGVLGTAVGVAWIGSAGTVIGPLAGITTAVSVELEKQKWEEKEQNQQNKSDIEEKGGAMK